MSIVYPATDFGYIFANMVQFFKEYVLPLQLTYFGISFSVGNFLAYVVIGSVVLRFVAYLAGELRDE